MIGEEYTVTAMCPPPLDFSWSPVNIRCIYHFPQYITAIDFSPPVPIMLCCFMIKCDGSDILRNPSKCFFAAWGLFVQFLFFGFLLWRRGFYWENLQKQPQFSLIYSSRPLIIVSKTRGLDTEHIDRWFWYSVFWTTKK